MACREEPPRSFRLLMALYTISEVRGCAGFERGFFAALPPDLLFFGDPASAGGAAAADAAPDALVSAMTRKRRKENGEQTGVEVASNTALLVNDGGGDLKIYL